MKKYHILMMFLMLAGMGMMTSCGGSDNDDLGSSEGYNNSGTPQSPAEWIVGTWTGSKGKEQYKFTFNSNGKGSGTVTDQYNIRTNYTFSYHFNGSAVVCEAVATHVVPDPDYVDTPVGVELEFMIAGQSLIFDGVTLNK